MQTLKDIQEQMGFPPLQKIDPNTGDVKESIPDSRTRLGQAAIPAGVTAVAKFASSEMGLAKLAEGPEGKDWVDEILGGQTHAVISRVADYAGVDQATASRTLGDAIRQTVHNGAHIHVNSDPSSSQRAYYAGLLSEALTFLPAAIPMGEVMDDNTIDDGTHKMEGPLSSIAHSIEKVFSDIHSENPKDRP
jgi:hypothetical protein